jgi:beta-1,2-mannosidase
LRAVVSSCALLAVLGGPAHQQSWMLGPFTKPPQVNPVISPNPAVAWEAYATFNPAAVVKDGKVFLLYRAEDTTGQQQIGGHTSRLGLAESTDGLHFTRRATPVLYPDTDAQRPNEWPGGVEDPRIVERDDGTYVLTYTQWNRDVPRLAVATSRDLISWTKHGPAFAGAAGGKYLRSESKSGAILSRVAGERIIATRVNGKYWMYFGVPDLRIATSDNLLDWTPLEDAEGRAIKVLSPRSGYFDSWLVEGGPPALITAQGILVLYNAGSLPSHTYSAGQALFDVRDPTKLIARADSAFIKPTESYERTGQYTAGTTFVEGLVPFRGRWFLYYGTADSRVGVAVWDPQAPADRILGTWHGTSICVDKQVDSACHDEAVVYVIDSAAGPRGPVRWQADKIVNQVREPMGVSRLTYDSSGDNWFVDINARFRGRWTLMVRGDSIVGDLSELPAHRLVRRIAVQRMPR